MSHRAVLQQRQLMVSHFDMFGQSLHCVRNAYSDSWHQSLTSKSNGTQHGPGGRGLGRCRLTFGLHELTRRPHCGQSQLVMPA
ncbi:hypothetical protein LIA77_06175 [Sarocladium implicatum]|nr:hypothetical protein LIA77_06175 [Sarocladium implicatum]